MTPYNLTEDSLESQFGVCYMGHFLLTGLLLPIILKAENSRIVSLGSTAYKYGGIQFDDIKFEREYNAKKAYGQAKSACILSMTDRTSPSRICDSLREVPG